MARTKVSGRMCTGGTAKRVTVAHPATPAPDVQMQEPAASDDQMQEPAAPLNLQVSFYHVIEHL